MTTQTMAAQIRRTCAALAVLASIAAVLPASAQTWEMMPLLPYRVGQRVSVVDFLLGDVAADDSLVVVRESGAFIYNPSGAAGAAGENGYQGEWGAWHPLCARGLCADYGGFVTTSGAIVIGDQNRRIRRSTDRGRTWTQSHPDLMPTSMAELTLGAFLGPDGTPGILAGVGGDGDTALSFGDGAPGTWEIAGRAFSFHQSIGEVPPSSALPNGRVLLGLWNGIVYSDDRAATWHPSSAYCFACYIAWSFAWRPVAGHPYGGTVYAGVQNVVVGELRGAEVLRSDDGGLTWTLAHSFTGAEFGFPSPQSGDFTEVVLFVTPDGALWAGAALGTTFGNPARGIIARSTDGGATWQSADAGFRDASGRGYTVYQFALARDGRLYAATSYSVWRTTAPVVTAAGEAPPATVPEVGVSVRPNPAGGRVEVVLSLAAAGAARVAIVDALGREVAVVVDGPVPAGETVRLVETGAWPPGVYVVRATLGGGAGAQTATARLVVAL